MDQQKKALYDRQLYVLGEHAMHRMAGTNVLIVGLGGLGVEVAKNVILTGVGSVTLYDPKPVSWSDLSAQFYFAESSVGKNRVTECKRHLAELNQYVKVLEHHGELTEEFLKGFQIVIFTDSHTGQLVDINNACRKNGSRFIAAESRGVFGSIFTDFGSDFEVHDVDGEEPITRIIVDLSYDDHNQITVSVHDDERHGLSDGDCVKFSDLSGSGMDAFNHCKTPLEVKSTGAYTFTVKAPNGVDLKSIGAKYERGGYVTQVKEVRKLNFKSLAESLEEPDFLDYDFAKLDFPPQLHLCFRALSQYAQQNNRLPKPYSAADAENLLAVAKQINESAKNKIDINEDIIKKFAFTCAGNINPMAAFVGGFAAQEVQKAATGKFTPIRQFLYFDALECLPDNLPTEQDAQPTGSRYDGQIAVFGQAVQNQLLSSRVFLVGSGALGCEFLKNFAMMGVGCGANGKVIVTDMDNIEISNLNRQFLFRNHHIGKSKSVTAAEQVKSMNPHFNVAALNDKVAPETESIFDDNFWDSIDIVTNALDNVEARLYTDSRCVYYKKPLLESGTLGTKGNVQVVLPHLTESYASSRDPPEKSFPSCTIKNFPSMIEHTIIWAKDYFAGSFQKNIEECNTFLGRDDYIDTLQSGKLQALQTIHENLLTARAGTLEECVVWARLKFEELFNHQIKQLLHSFPLDAKTNTGAAFWSGPKRPPTPIEFDPNDATHMQFILAAANLRAFNYGLNGERDPEKLKPIVANVMVPEFVPRNIKIQTEENKEENKKPETEDLTGDEAAIGALEKDLGGFKSSSAGYRLVPVEFDKDNDENFHIDFITATSNLRARNYKIPEADRHKTKGIAGKIIPAMVTTTALITGLVAMEFYKTLLGKKQLEAYKNSFINIAIPFITLSEPMPAPKNKYDDTEWTLWDRFEVNEGRDITLGELIDYFQNKYQLSISMMSCGSANIFSFFMQAARKQERLKMPVSEVVRTVSKKEFYPTQKYVNLEVLCENKNGDDVDTPYIRYQFRGF